MCAPRRDFDLDRVSISWYEAIFVETQELLLHAEKTYIELYGLPPGLGLIPGGNLSRIVDRSEPVSKEDGVEPETDNQMQVGATPSPEAINAGVGRTVESTPWLLSGLRPANRVFPEEGDLFRLSGAGGREGAGYKKVEILAGIADENAGGKGAGVVGGSDRSLPPPLPM